MMFRNPKSLEEALQLRSASNWSIVSGGTDYYPGLGDQQPDGNILDVSQLQGMREFKQLASGSWSIGACVTWTDILEADLPPAFDGLKLAAKEIGSIQIQNRATLVGNICNASPAADGIPPLLSLDAIVDATSVGGTREIPMADFVLGNRQTDLRADEIVTSITIPKSAAKGLSSFIKLGARKYLVISISMVAARLDLDSQNIILDAAISVGSCSLVAKRLSALEAALVGQQLSEETCDIATMDHLFELSPIDDVRATGTYRMDASLELVRRAISNIYRAV